MRKMLLFRMTRFQLILISWLLVIAFATQAQESLKEEILSSFYASQDYQNYLKQKPLTQQVIVTIEIIELAERIDFPNPYVARLFHLYLKGSTNLSSKRVTSEIIYLPG
mgnify:FL=1